MLHIVEKTDRELLTRPGSLSLKVFGSGGFPSTAGSMSASQLTPWQCEALPAAYENSAITPRA
ncbi:MAG: hypothetical protein IPL59_00070 [Candidatus Competibacteraceae bacterium]|nr:hypothetical protein [Candidatus Competibacteraceae bacterium]